MIVRNLGLTWDWHDVITLYQITLISTFTYSETTCQKSIFYEDTICFEILFWNFVVVFLHGTLNNFWIWRNFSEFFFLSRASSNSSFITFGSIFEEFLKSAFRKSFRIENISIFKDFRLIFYFSVRVHRQPSSSITLKINLWRYFEVSFQEQNLVFF